jgi:hypothetical protein
MISMREELIDQNWQSGDKFSLLGYLKYLCYRALYSALVGKSGVPAQPLSIPVRSEAPGDPPSRASWR